MIALQMLTVSTRKEVLHVLVRRFMLVMERRAQILMNVPLELITVTPMRDVLTESVLDSHVRVT